jgi:glycosyltransferase involved in cell wall biosynthesis
VEEIFSDSALQFAEPGNANDMADKIIELCKDPDMRNEKRQKGFQEFQKHTSQVIGVTYLNIINKNLS